MIRLALVIISILLLSCQPHGHKKPITKGKSMDNASIHHTSYQSKNPYSSQASGPGTTAANEFEIDWKGKWHYEEDMIKYSITIDQKLKDMNRCIYHVEGIPAFYVLECKGIAKGNVFELYYRYTNDGNFIREDKIDPGKPILTLSLVNGKVITHWNQLPGGRNGQECFKKKV